MKTYRESICAKRLEQLKAEMGPSKPVKVEPVRTEAELIAAAAAWEVEVTPELIANVAEREMRIKGEM
jgi:hypothetical protein